MTGFSRRDLIAAPAILTLATRLGAIGATDPFTLGVASGDPWPDGMVLWTRLAPQPLQPDGGMPATPVPVRWELATDPAFKMIVRHGAAIAEPFWGHSVHVELNGLQPGRPYWYRFIAGGIVSPIGRTRTAPSAGAKVDQARFAYCSCQKWEVGYYTAYKAMVADDPEIVFFVGDYIYEEAPGTGPDVLRPHVGPKCTDLDSYRVRYSQYKTDPCYRLRMPPPLG